VLKIAWASGIAVILHLVWHWRLRRPWLCRQREYHSLMPRRSSRSSLFRAACIAVVLACAGLLGYAYWLQFREFLDPCPLCIFQRLAFAALGAVALVGALHNPRGFGRKAYALLGALVALTGAAIAARHVWIQSLPPDRVPECGPGLDFMLANLPFIEALQKALTGSGECAAVAWSFMGLSMPWWTLLWYLALGALLLITGFRRSR
jgi:disulfide bond formation protein DsbB